MYLKPINISFTYEERMQLKTLMGGYKPQKELERQVSQADKFKYTLQSYIHSVRNDLQEKNQVIKSITQLLSENKILKQTKQRALVKDYKQVNSAILKLKTFLRQKQADSQSYNSYVSFLCQLRDLKQQQLLQFQMSLKKSKLNPSERQNIKALAKKVVQSNEAQLARRSNCEINQFLSEVALNGFSKQPKSLQAIQDKNLKKKFQALVQEIQQNYLQIQTKHQYRENLFKKLITRMTNNIYPREQVLEILRNLPPGLQIIIQPLFKQLCKLRQPLNNRPGHNIKGGYLDIQIKQAEEESLKQLLADYALANSKADKLQTELRKLRWFIKAVNSIGSSLQQKQVHNQVGEFIQQYQIQEMRFCLLKIYKKFNNYSKEETANTFLEERTPNSLRNQQQGNQIAELLEKNKKLRAHIIQLQQQRASYSIQKRGLLKNIEEHKELLQGNKKKLKKFQNAISNLQQLQSEKILLIDEIKRLQQENKNKSIQLKNQTELNQRLSQTIKLNTRQKQQIRQRIQKLELQASKAEQRNQDKGKLQRYQDKGKRHQYGQYQKWKDRKYETQKQQLQRHIDRLQSQLGQYRQAIQEFQSKRDQIKLLQANFAKLTEQNDYLRAKLKQPVKTKQLSPQKIANTDQLNQKLHSQIAELKQIIEELGTQAKKRQAKMKQQISSLQGSEQKLKQNYKKLYDHFISLKEKISELKKQNERLKSSKIEQKQQITMKQRGSAVQLQQKYKQIEQGYHNLKKASQKEISKKQEEISKLSLLLQQLQRRSDKRDDPHQQQIKNEKIQYLQSTVRELQQQNYEMKMELQRKEQQIMMLKLRS